MHVVGLRELGECPNLLVRAAIQTRDANQGFCRALPVFRGAVRVHELLERSEVMRIELQTFQQRVDDTFHVAALTALASLFEQEPH